MDKQQAVALQELVPPPSAPQLSPQAGTTSLDPTPAGSSAGASTQPSPSAPSVTEFGALSVLTLRRNIRYARIDPTIDKDSLKQLLRGKPRQGQDGRPVDGWNLPKPYIVVSVLARDWPKEELSESGKVLQSKHRKHLVRGLMKVAQTDGVWILTDGLERGFLKLLGAAIEKLPTASPTDLSGAVCLGIPRYEQIRAFDKWPRVRSRALLYKH